MILVAGYKILFEMLKSYPETGDSYNNICVIYGFKTDIHADRLIITTS